METPEIYEKLKEYFEEELKEFDYHIIVALNKPLDNERIDAKGFTFSNLNGKTSFSIVKASISNIIGQANQLLKMYELTPAEPLFKDEKRDKK